MATLRNVPFFDYPSLFAEIETEIMTTVREVFARGAYIMQSDLLSLERELAAYLGVKHVLGVADGTMGLLLPLLAMGLEAGEEVILPSHTFVASAAAIHHAGGKPVLVDCGPDHLVDPESIARAVTSKTRAIMPVQLNGRTADMDQIQEIANRHGLFIVEDSCQAFGSKFNGRFAGTFGIAGSLSFYPSKTLGCLGDGGAVITDDDEMAAKIRMLRDHGRGSDGDVWTFGFNSRLDNVQAAILRLKLKRYDQYIARRRQLASLYDSRLSEIDELLLPPAPETDSRHFDIYQNYEIEAEKRDELRQYLDDRGIRTIVQWGGKTIHQFSRLNCRNMEMSYTEQMTGRFMLLPMNTALKDDDVEFVCECVKKFYLC